MATREQSLKRPGVLLLTCATTPLVSEYLLHMVKELLRNEGFVQTFMVLPCPDEVSIIDGISKHAMNAATGDFHTIARLQALIKSLFCQVFE